MNTSSNRPRREARIRGLNLRSPATLTTGARAADDSIIKHMPKFINNLGSPRHALILRLFAYILIDYAPSRNSAYSTCD
jgi:hypothetical protein